MRPADKREQAGGDRAKGKKKPLPLRYSRFVRAIELHEMARDDKSIPHVSSRHIPISFSSRSSSRFCVSSPRLVLVIYRLVFAFHLIVLLLRLVSSHHRSHPCRYRIHRLLSHPFIYPRRCRRHRLPYVTSSPHLCSPAPAALSISSSPNEKSS